ncbi:hypothetical protein J4208_00170 [Candidatus Woesearchaeota archaeon]|nr:hypothetical protein [Candidatus Woesearchaeota archaeon]
MTTETQTKEQGSLTSRLAGVVAGMNLAAGTLACMDHPILFPYVAMGAVIGSALAHDGVTITKAAGGITIGLAVTVVTGLNNFLSGKNIENIVSGLATGVGVAVPLAIATADKYLQNRYDLKEARNRMSNFAKSACLTTVLLTSSYFVTRNLI